jgi:solute carrier family 25 phosphate transporter 3
LVVTLTALQWLIYDTFKVASGLPATGAAPEPTKSK